MLAFFRSVDLWPFLNTMQPLALGILAGVMILAGIVATVVFSTLGGSSVKCEFRVDESTPNDPHSKGDDALVSGTFISFFFQTLSSWNLGLLLLPLCFLGQEESRCLLTLVSTSDTKLRKHIAETLICGVIEDIPNGFRMITEEG